MCIQPQLFYIWFHPTILKFLLILQFCLKGGAGASIGGVQPGQVASLTGLTQRDNSYSFIHLQPTDMN